MMDQWQSLLDRATPVGIIPANYAHVEKLCKAARIGFKVHRRTNADGTPREWREWYVVWDDQTYPRKHRTPTGKLVSDPTTRVRGAQEHLKFCGIMAFVYHRAGEVMRDAGIEGKIAASNVLDVAIGIAEGVQLPNGDTIDLGPKLRSFRLMDFRALAKELSAAGMSAYDDVAQVPSGTDSLPDL